MVPPILKQPYFVPHRPGTSDTVRDADNGVVVEEIPPSVDPDDFAPKLVNATDEYQMTPLERAESTRLSSRQDGSGRQDSTGSKREEGVKQSVMTKLFGGKTRRQVKFSALDESAKKAAPKLFFAGERTFLQWMHAGILLAAISMGLSSHADTGSTGDWIAVLLLPVAIGIMVHAMAQFSKRSYMIASRSPGPYEDRWGPVWVGSVFAFSLLVQFAVVLVKRSQ